MRCAIQILNQNKILNHLSLCLIVSANYCSFVVVVVVVFVLCCGCLIYSQVTCWLNRLNTPTKIIT